MSKLSLRTNCTDLFTPKAEALSARCHLLKMNSTSHQYSALLKAAFAVTVWGASFIATKLALREVSPVVVIWLRFGIGVVILGGFIVRRKELAFPSRRELGYFALLGFLGITFHQWLQVTGLVTAKATTTAWIITTIPISSRSSDDSC